MDYRTIEVTLVSAAGLKKHGGRMRTYAVVWVDPYQRQTTRTDDKGGRNPTWNETLTLPVPSYLFQQPQTAGVNVQIHSRRRFLRNKLLGWVQVPLTEIIAASAGGGQGDNPQAQESTYPVFRRIGKAKGSLRLKMRVTGGPIPTAPPPPPPSAPAMSVPYPPQPPSAPTVDGDKSQPAIAYPSPYYKYNNNYAGAPPPQPAYPYPPQPAPYPYYGAPVVAPPPPRRSGGGMGLGTGLLAGALGGLILGEVVDDFIF